MRPSEQHTARIYLDDEELVAAVVADVAEGWRRGEPAVLVATPEHARLILERLQRDDPVLVADAAETLAQIMDGDVPSPARFDRVVGGLLDEARRRFGRKPPRVFGEMVDLLCAAGRSDAAAQLEALWNRLARRRRFSLLCGYRLDVFDRSAQTTTLPAVCELHSHVVPVVDEARFSRAVEGALQDVLGRDDAALVRSLVGMHGLRERAPAAQLALMWVSRNMPFRARRVLAASRANYAR